MSSINDDLGEIGPPVSNVDDVPLSRAQHRCGELTTSSERNTTCLHGLEQIVSDDASDSDGGVELTRRRVLPPVMLKPWFSLIPTASQFCFTNEDDVDETCFDNDPDEEDTIAVTTSMARLGLSHRNFGTSHLPSLASQPTLANVQEPCEAPQRQTEGSRRDVQSWLDNLSRMPFPSIPSADELTQDQVNPYYNLGLFQIPAAYNTYVPYNPLVALPSSSAPTTQPYNALPHELPSTSHMHNTSGNDLATSAMDNSYVPYNPLVALPSGPAPTTAPFDATLNDPRDKLHLHSTVHPPQFQDSIQSNPDELHFYGEAEKEDI